jgi:signal transduction histidine kinase
MMTVTTSCEQELTDVAWLPQNVDFEHIKDQRGPRSRRAQGDSEVAEVVHDFRNTLGAVSMLSQLMLLELSEDCPARQMAHDIRMACLDAAAWCEQILASSSGSRDSHERIELSSFVAKMAPLLETYIPRGSELRFVLAADLPPLNLASGEIRQLVLNLVKNASEALVDRPGTVTVSTSEIESDAVDLRTRNGDGVQRSNGHVCLAVSDNGCGMDEPTQSRLQAGSYTTKLAGHGLGLASVRRIAAAHGARLLFDSHVGVGTTISVDFGDGEFTHDMRDSNGTTAGFRRAEQAVLPRERADHRAPVVDVLRPYGAERFVDERRRMEADYV